MKYSDIQKQCLSTRRLQSIRNKVERLGEQVATNCIKLSVLSISTGLKAGKQVVQRPFRL